MQRKELFREKSLERLNAPEQLTEYIRVANPSAWLILLAIAILIAGGIVWMLNGELETSVSVVAVTESGGCAVYIPEDELSGIEVGDNVCSETEQTVITAIAERPAPAESLLDDYAMHLAGLAPEDWVYGASLESPLTEDTVMVNIISETIRPLEFFSEN